MARTVSACPVLCRLLGGWLSTVALEEEGPVVIAFWALKAECGFGIAVYFFAWCRRSVLHQKVGLKCIVNCYIFSALEELIG